MFYFMVCSRSKRMPSDNLSGNLWLLTLKYLQIECTFYGYDFKMNWINKYVSILRSRALRLAMFNTRFLICTFFLPDTNTLFWLEECSIFIHTVIVDDMGFSCFFLQLINRIMFSRYCAVYTLFYPVFNRSSIKLKIGFFIPPNLR